MYTKKNIDKPVLMIHEFKEEYLCLSLEDYILSFDDALMTQYLFLPDLYDLDTTLIFNIPTGVVNSTGEPQSWDFITCQDAMLKAKSGNYENYMNWSQIKFINSLDNTIISGHSHSHTDLRLINNLRYKCEYINNDSEKMFKEFEKHLQISPSIFTFPYNVSDRFYKGILETNFGITEFQGGERIDIEVLL